ncbi:bifunctional metallophosphatase/5'-nucleotidase [Amycolatopsis sp. AA4]|uniref:bifunctional metallophosphatase/5'-nucleotidase n=1 Tax=Actinomycetes TaxID=1760 RepID=UPI0001B55BF9|nr:MULTISPECIES: bifunctional UDP-sugar hydrolase/5'-nucleotidase [Actinomycetes]ATY15626.1 bifunctional metallophosphatase/5'-nucleotidase [Amycolatopsis sp. AA4]EFL11915.1 5prime nucleotidase [Streptomyces sp. AA4]
MKLFTRLAATAAAALATVAVTSAPAEAAQTTDVRIIAFNDLHGNLEPPSGSSGRITLPDGSKVDAGGAAYLATHVKQLEAQVRNSMVLSSGDNIGASPVISALFHDEPTMDFLNELGVKASVVGNHEFDEGYQELLRMQFGGCNKTDGCQFRKSYDGARFPLLGSNVYFDNGLPALLPFSIQYSGGVPIGVIGATLKDLPSVVTPEAIKGLKFGDEVEAINRTANILDRLGVKAQVVLLHQGDEALPGAGPNDCKVQPDGAAATIAKNVTPKVDAIFTAHSHQQYNCVVNDPAGQPRPVIQGASFGRLLSVVDLKIDRRTRDVVRSQTKAHNEIVTRDVTPDPAVTKLVDEAKTKAAPIANKQVGTITADLPAAGGPSGESPLGDVIADAQLEATKSNNAVIAMTNPGGIRADLTYKSSSAGEGDGVVTYGEAFTVQPFSNIMQTITLTGANLKNVLEQQWGQSGGTKILQISKSLHYTYSAGAPVGSRVSNITVNGTPVDPAAKYRVSVNNFLAAGGDGFTEFKKGTDLAGGPVDLDAFIAYLGAHPGIAPPPADRITATP